MADAGRELAGLTGVHRDARLKTRHSATLWGVYVRPKYRGQRVTDRMVSEALIWCRSNQVRILRLTVAAANAPAIRSYLRCGFSICGISPEEIRIADTFHDEILMWRKV